MGFNRFARFVSVALTIVFISLSGTALAQDKPSYGALFGIAFFLLLLDFVKFHAVRSPHSAVTRERLPAPYDYVPVNRIDFDPIAPPAGALAGDHRRAAAEERIEHDVAARGAVHDRVGDHRDRLDGWVHGKQVALFAAAGKRIRARVVPDVSAISLEPTELHVVPVALGTVPVHEHQLVLAPIE